MTKDEMLEKFSPQYGKENNYEEAQKRIAEAMTAGEPYVLLPREEYKYEFSWWATSDTISRLYNDGFKINEYWQPEEYYSVEWGYEE